MTSQNGADHAQRALGRGDRGLRDADGVGRDPGGRQDGAPADGRNGAGRP